LSAFIGLGDHPGERCWHSRDCFASRALVCVLNLAHGAAFPNYRQNFMSVLLWILFASCNIANIFGSLHTKSTEALESSNRRVLTMNVTSVPGFRPLFSTATPIEPIRPSKLSRKNPGCRILFSWLVSLPFQITRHTEH
jgi:hypothetical protein